MFILRLIALAALPACAARAQASLSLDAALARALRDNPDLRLARLRADSARGETRIARALPALAFSTIPGNPLQYSVGAPIDIGPQRWLRTRAAGRGLDAAAADTADVRRQVSFAVRQAYYDVLLGEAMRGIFVEQRGLFRDLLTADSARLRSGDLPARDVIKNEVELARADADVARAGAQVHALRLTLQLAMGVEHPDTGLTLDGELAYRPISIPVDSLAALAPERRPDIRAAERRAEQSRELQRLASADLAPVPSLALVYQRDSPFDNGSHYAVAVGLSLPLLYWYGGERERSRAGVDAADVAERRTRAQVAADVRTAIEGFRTARALVERYTGGLMANSQAALDAARYAYRAGAASLVEVVDAIRTHAAVRSDYATALHDYWIGVFALGRATGTEVVP